MGGQQQRGLARLATQRTGPLAVDVERPGQSREADIRQQRGGQHRGVAVLGGHGSEGRPGGFVGQVVAAHVAGSGCAGGVHTRALPGPVLHLVQFGGQRLGLDRGVEHPVRGTQGDRDQVGAGYQPQRGMYDLFEHVADGGGVEQRAGQRGELGRQRAQAGIAGRVVRVSGVGDEVGLVPRPVLLVSHRG